MGLFDVVYRGSDEMYFKAEAAVKETIEKIGADAPVAFGNTAYYLACIKAYTGLEVKTMGELEAALQPIRAMMTRGGHTADVFHSGVATAMAAEVIEACKYAVNPKPFGDADDLTEAVIEDTLRTLEPYQELINIAIAPHAVYTVSEKGLKRCAEMAKKYGLLYHIHMSETQNEVDNCLKQYGCRPYELLERIGVLDLTEGHFSGAHSLYVDDNEIAIMGRHHITATHNPCSNLKLGSGHFFHYTELRDAGVNVTLGTDGCSSSNNLDMIEAAKFMSYLQKGVRQDPTVLPAPELLQVASQNGFHVLGIDAGAIETGRCADLMLVSLDNLAFVPNNDTLANLFYAAHGDAVDTVICNGNIVMQNRAIPSEEETIREARRATQKLLK